VRRPTQERQRPRHASESGEHEVTWLADPSSLSDVKKKRHV
jgi:hypothetical protein